MSEFYTNKFCFVIFLIFIYIQYNIDQGVDIEDSHDPLEEDDDFEDQLRQETSEHFSLVSRRTHCDFLGTDKQGRHIFGIYASRFPIKSQMEIFIR